MSKDSTPVCGFEFDEEAPKPPRPASDFRTTVRVVGGEEAHVGVRSAALVYGGMVVQIPEPIFLAWLRGHEGKGWNGIRQDEFRDLVGGMKEIRRRMGVAARDSTAMVKKREAEKPPDEPDLDKLLGDL